MCILRDKGKANGSETPREIDGGWQWAVATALAFNVL